MRYMKKNDLIGSGSRIKKTKRLFFMGKFVAYPNK